MKVILYPEPTGVAVLFPSGEIPFEEVGRKDVPEGVPYLIVDADELPSDARFQAAWEVDFDKPHGHGIGHDAWREEQRQRKLQEQPPHERYPDQHDEGAQHLA